MDLYMCGSNISYQNLKNDLTVFDYTVGELLDVM